MSAVLHYFNGRGKAEIVRLTMAVAGVEWTQENLTEKEHFQKLKSDGKLLFGQVPLVEFEGKLMVQSGSITRFFAKRGHLLGENDDEAFKIDCLFEGTRDLNMTFMPYGFQGWEEVLDKARKVDLPKYLPVYNRVLKENGSNGFLVGSKLSLADIGLLEPVLSVEELLGEKELEAYPEIQKFLATMKSNELIANYLKTKRQIGRASCRERV